jgi:hypothetical protein
MSVFEYPCRQPFHEFQVIDFYKGICKCLYCPCQVSKVKASEYHEWKKEQLK